MPFTVAVQPIRCKRVPRARSRRAGDDTYRKKIAYVMINSRARHPDRPCRTKRERHFEGSQRRIESQRLDLRFSLPATRCSGVR